MNKMKKMNQWACYNRIWTWPSGLSYDKNLGYWVPRAMFFTRHGRPWSNPTALHKLCLTEGCPSWYHFINLLKSHCCVRRPIQIFWHSGVHLNSTDVGSWIFWMVYVSKQKYVAFSVISQYWNGTCSQNLCYETQGPIYSALPWLLMM